MAQPITADKLNQITSTIIAAAIKVHRALGPGLLESAYPCLCCELKTTNVQFEVQKSLPLVYRGIRIECAYRADLSWRERYSWR